MISAICHRHQPEVNPLLVPLVKICSSCGRTESLDDDEICWPSKVRFYTRRNWRSFRGSLYLVPLLLISIAAIFWIAQSAFREKSSKEPRGTDRGRSIASTQSRFAVSSLTVSEDPLSPLAGNGRSPAGKHEPEQGKNDKAAQETATTLIETPPTNNVIPDSIESNNDPDVRNSTAQALESRIAKLITDRAIPGVKVTVAKDTVHLNGAVKTQNQKLLAEQAAKSVQGIKEVRNMLRVEWQGTNS
jgi:hypothetical protein